MIRVLRLKRGNTAVTNTFVGKDGEVTIDTDKHVIVVHDGVTPGGYPQSQGGVTFGETAPLNPHDGDIWIDSSTGIEYIFYTDEDSGQWVEFGPTNTQVNPGFLMIDGGAASTAYDVTDFNIDGGAA